MGWFTKKEKKTLLEKRPIDRSALRSPERREANLQKLAKYIVRTQGGVLSSEIRYGELMLEVEAEEIADFLKFLRDDSKCAFSLLIDICGVDYPERPDRFEVVYHLLSMVHNQRIRVKVRIGEDEPLPSVVSVYPGANWFEREAFDLYGILFSSHPDLRRLLTDYGFEGHPMRKDFPLTGFVETRYDEAREAVVYEPVKLTQEFRQFDFLSPWEGMDDPKSNAPPPGMGGDGISIAGDKATEDGLASDKPSIAKQQEPQFADPDKDHDTKIS